MFQIIDVNYNRAREGLRVVEEIARFLLKSTDITQKIRKIRHSLKDILADTGFHYLEARNIEKDFGKDFTSSSYKKVTDMCKANFSRVEESMRVIEEFMRLRNSVLSKKIMDLRFLCYDLEKELIFSLLKREKLSKIGVYLITDEKIAHKPLEKIVADSLEGGIRFIQFRDKYSTTLRLYEKGKKIKELTDNYSAVLIVNDRIDVALSIDADGVHIGKDDMPVNEARNILGYEKIIGSTVRSLEEAKEAIREGADYVSIGPIFPTISKKGLPPPIGLEILRNVRKGVNGVLVAIGGINLSHLLEIKKIGIDGVAIISGILKEGNIRENAKRWVEEWKKVRRI